MSEKKINQLKTILAEISDIQAAAGLLGWDQQVNMPPMGAKARGQQIGTLRSIAHQKFTSTEVGLLLDELIPFADSLNPDSDEARLIRLTRHRYEKQIKVPREYIIERALITSTGLQIWQQARRENNFSLFRPSLEKVVELRQRYANFFTPYDHVYDPLLDDFEQGMKTTEVKSIFATLRPQQVELLRKINSQPQVDDRFLFQDFDEQRQWDFGVKIITHFGYDWQRGRQDKSAHPFTSSSSIDDVRITTRVFRNFLCPALFATMHEAGHALYNQGIDPRYSRSPLTGGASLAVHESQSRTWENLVGRSLPFWEFFYPQLQTIFPEQLTHVDLLSFYKGINRVQPSLIRVEADEATYNLHIMLRLELEISLMEGTLAVKDLPEAWNNGMKEYLGITPPDDSDGVLQDVHWAGGNIGYFSTYALGNLVSAQLWECIRRDIPDLDEQFRQGEFFALLNWSREKIHRHGSIYEPQELVERVTGSKINPESYVRYLNQKFGDIYGLP